MNSTGRRQRYSLLDHILQVAVAAAAIAVVVGLGSSIYYGLAAHKIPINFGFLSQSSGLHLTEGTTLDWSHGLTLKSFVSSDSNLQALILGLYNTLKVALLGILLSTLLGLLVGAGRVSLNWMVNHVSLCFVELIRNTPLLIQLFFWYFAVVLQLPPLRAASSWYGTIASRQGIYTPGVVVAGAWPYFWWAVLASLVALGAAARIAKKSPAKGLAAGAMVVAIGWIVAAALLGAPLHADIPIASRFRASGGLAFSPEFAAILLALVVYTSAFISEIVRGSIEAVSKGQWMASYALGLTRRQAMISIILPQAFRILVPPLVNQYLNLAKNTSLAIAIGFPDLFNIYGTIANQTGRSMEGILIVMLAYLMINWLISLIMNIYNRRLLARGAR
ncbi:ABC transporter permease subunit [Paralcaligenes ureilyticus]|uniref:General L-amino acid transport system permease protein n=1 Tax=Paralcaligenes ureilyticus TaxID=627131 RepID=A0A4R3M5T9_9BURK|nr:ABC transporter permease subunit [Paralcaligenes ureilyticus]TCT08670.1 general L-amino acid transport system permease protein [Paralcaligenes ureilyticus]